MKFIATTLATKPELQDL